MNTHTQANGGLVNFDNPLYGNDNQGTQTSVRNGVAVGVGTNGGPHYDMPRGKPEYNTIYFFMFCLTADVLWLLLHLVLLSCTIKMF